MKCTIASHFIHDNVVHTDTPEMFSDSHLHTGNLPLADLVEEFIPCSLGGRTVSFKVFHLYA